MKKSFLAVSLYNGIRSSAPVYSIRGSDRNSFTSFLISSYSNAASGHCLPQCVLPEIR